MYFYKSKFMLHFGVILFFSIEYLHPYISNGSSTCNRGWSGGAMVLGELPVPGRPTIWMIVGQGPTALAIGAGGGCLDIFTLLCPFSPLSPSLWETARYRLKYCLKGPLNLNQPTNQSTCNKVLYDIYYILQLVLFARARQK